MILSACADVSAKDRGGWTAMSEACYWFLKLAAKGDTAGAGRCFCAADIRSKHGGDQDRWKQQCFQ